MADKDSNPAGTSAVQETSRKKPEEQKSWLGRRLDNGRNLVSRGIVVPFNRGLDNGMNLLLRGVFRILYGRKVTGLENFKNLEGKPILIVANHISELDAFALASVLPVRPAFAMKKSAYEDYKRKNPFYRFLFSRSDILPLDPSHPQAIKELIRLAKSGKPVMIFPEGRLTRHGTLMKIMDGAAMVAHKSGANIVPIHLDGLQFLSYGNDVLRGYPHHWRSDIRVDIGKPRKIEVPDNLKGREARREAHRQLQSIMEELPLLSVDSKATLMDELHRAAGNYGMGRKIITDPEREITYRELLAGAYTLGGKLAKMTEKSENVGVLLPNSVGNTVTFWALQAYGRVPTMLNPKAETSDMVSYTETASLKTILTSRRMLEKMPDLAKKIEILSEKCRIVYLEDIKDEIGLGDKLAGLAKARGLLPRPEDRSRDGNDPAVVLFTSGSEALPKGVILSSSNILSNVVQLHAVTPISPNNDKVFNAMPLFHSFGMSGGMIMPVLNGINSYQFPSPLEAKKIPLAVYDFDATIMFGTNTFLNLYEKYADGEDFSRLRWIFTGAEALTDDTYNKYIERFGVVPYQGYGMTEASPCVSINVPGAHKKGTVGRFLPGIETRLEDVPGVEDGKRLYIRGPNIMLGYLKNDKPGVIQAPKNGWHDTGDIVTVDRDGYVKLAGRAKRFAKIGGEMVSFDVVEQIARAASHDKDAEHAVILGKDPVKGSEKIILFTTDKKMNNKNLGTAAKELQKAILGLPKNPDIHVVEDIPHLPTGKTDYVRLSKIFNEMADDKDDKKISATAKKATRKKPSASKKASAKQGTTSTPAP